MRHWGIWRSCVRRWENKDTWFPVMAKLRTSLYPRAKLPWDKEEFSPWGNWDAASLPSFCLPQTVWASHMKSLLVLWMHLILLSSDLFKCYFLSLDTLSPSVLAWLIPTTVLWVTHSSSMLPWCPQILYSCSTYYMGTVYLLSLASPIMKTSWQQGLGLSFAHICMSSL